MERPLKERLVGATILVVMGVLLIPWALDGKSRSKVRYQNQSLTLPGSSEHNLETRTISLDASTPGGSAAPLEPDSSSQGRVTTTKPVGNLPVAARPPKDAAEQQRERDGQAAAAITTQATASTDNEENKPKENAGAPAQQVASSSSASKNTNQASTSGPPATFADTPSPNPGADDPANNAKATPAASKAPATANTSDQWAVQVGAFAKQENAERLAERLRDKDYKAFVMRNVVEGRIRYRVRVGPVAQRAQADLLANALREDRQPAKVLAHP